MSRKTGFYWVQLENNVWIVAKWWASYGWWTQMDGVLEANPGSKFKHIHEQRLTPPVLEQKRIKRIRRNRL